MAAIPLERGAVPHVETAESKEKFLKSLSKMDEPPPKDLLDGWIKDADRLIVGELFFWRQCEERKRSMLANVYVSECYSCELLTLWKKDQILFPSKRFGEEPHEEMPDDIKLDFEEARALLELSPRGAAALLRLCVQKLCMHLGGEGKNLNNDIAKLVGDGLSVGVKQALDVVRVIGNESVHPGQIDLRDNRNVAVQLLSIVNMIVDRMIGEPKRLKALHDALPAEKLAQIEERDRKATGGK